MKHRCEWSILQAYSASFFFCLTYQSNPKTNSTDQTQCQTNTPGPFRVQQKAPWQVYEITTLPLVGEFFDWCGAPVLRGLAPTNSNGCTGLSSENSTGISHGFLNVLWMFSIILIPFNHVSSFICGISTRILFSTTVEPLERVALRLVGCTTGFQSIACGRLAGRISWRRWEDLVEKMSGF